MQWIVLDLIALLIMAGCVYFAARAGFVRTILGLTSYIAAMLVSSYFAKTVAGWLYEAFADNFIKGFLRGNIRASIMRGEAPDSSLPIWLRAFFARLSDGDIAGIDFSGSIDRTVDVLVDSFLRNQIVWVLSAAVFLLLFALTAFILRQLIGVFGGLIEKLPIFGTIDTVLGGIVGGGQAVIILLVTAIVFHVVNMFSGGAVPWINPDVLSRGFIMRFFYYLTGFDLNA